VSSHIAASVDRTYGTGEAARTVHISLLPNSSHLEAINPVAIGKTRAKRDADGSDAMCLLIHGDAAASGQVCINWGFFELVRVRELATALSASAHTSAHNTNTTHTYTHVAHPAMFSRGLSLRLMHSPASKATALVAACT
jgi:hypothetical protein